MLNAFVNAEELQEATGLHGLANAMVSGGVVVECDLLRDRLLRLAWRIGGKRLGAWGEKHVPYASPYEQDVATTLVDYRRALRDLCSIHLLECDTGRGVAAESGKMEDPSVGEQAKPMLAYASLRSRFSASPRESLLVVLGPPFLVKAPAIAAMVRTLHGADEGVLAAAVDPYDVGLRFEPVRANALAAADRASRPVRAFAGALSVGFAWLVLRVLRGAGRRLTAVDRHCDRWQAGMRARWLRDIARTVCLLCILAGGPVAMWAGVAYARAVLHLLEALGFAQLRGDVLGPHVGPGRFVQGSLISVAVIIAVVAVGTLWIRRGEE